MSYRSLLADALPPFADSIEGFTVTSAGTLLVRRPLPRNIAASVVAACEPHRRYEAIRALEHAMEPATWLELALRCGAGLPDSPMAILEGLRRVFPLYRPNAFLAGDAAHWWATVDHPLTVWRGCYEGVNEAGICYSQDPLIASEYVRPGGCGRARAVLVEATVVDGDYIAHRRTRTELELWALPERPVVVARHPLPLPYEFFRARSVPLRERLPLSSVPAVDDPPQPKPSRRARSLAT